MTRALELGDPGYPDRLRTITSPPETLWVRGSLPPSAAVAIVGTRHPTRFGAEAARAAASSAVACGLAVVSGLAAGVDTIAHEAALAAGAATWAVVGSGVDVPTPSENTALAAEIVAAGGGLIAEVPPGTPVSPGRLVARDRIQAGLSLAVLVCQCETTSGTMHTARFALRYGRLLAVVRPPGPAAAEPASSGNLALIGQGNCEPSLPEAGASAEEVMGGPGRLADVVVESDEELVALFEHLASF